MSRCGTTPETFCPKSTKRFCGADAPAAARGVTFNTYDGETTMIEVKHGNHKITYDEASNTWTCKAMRCDAPSLAALRTKLNNEDRDDRRIGNIRAFSTD